MRKAAILVILSTLVTVPALAQEVAGDWIGQLNGGFKVRIHLEKSAAGYSGHLTNPSGNETELDQVTSDGKHLHFAVIKLNLSTTAFGTRRNRHGTAISLFSRFIR